MRLFTIMAKKKTNKGSYILRASFTDKNGVKHYAKEYGKKAFKIYVA